VSTSPDGRRFHAPRHRVRGASNTDGRRLREESELRMTLSTWANEPTRLRIPYLLWIQTKEILMYIGGGILGTILVVCLILYILRRV
jgi:hypothetical protein